MSKKVLVVDDSPVVRNALQDVLITEGFSVTTASHGIEGIEIVQQDAFDLMFLDIDMPKLSGLQVLRMLRNNPAFKLLPIIMLTARDRKQDKFWGIETGANAYLTKPFDQAKLLDTVREVIQKAEEKAAGGEALPADKAGPEPPEDAEVDIVFEAGEVQEKQLLKMTLVNKIFKVSVKNKSLKEACSSINGVFSDVLSYDLAIFMLTDDDLVKMYIFVNRPVSRLFFQAVKNRMLQEYERLSEKKFIQENAEVILDDPQHNIIRGSESHDIQGFHAHLLRSKGERYGIFAIARATEGVFNPDEAELINLIASQSNIVIDNSRMYEKLKSFAVADGLTTLYNHRYFQEQLEKEFSRARRFNLSLSLIMLDIDHFKAVNDTYGHQSGDSILKGISGIVKRSIREIDTPARYGGEEFVVILPETPKLSATVVAERIVSTIREHHFETEKGILRVTASIGVSGYPEDDINTRLDLISKSDLALYHAKRTGRDRTCLYSKELEEEFK